MYFSVDSVVRESESVVCIVHSFIFPFEIALVVFFFQLFFHFSSLAKAGICIFAFREFGCCCNKRFVGYTMKTLYGGPAILFTRINRNMYEDKKWKKKNLCDLFVFICLHLGL